MSAFKIGDKVRVTDVSTQRDKSLTVGDIGTVADVLTEPKWLIESVYGSLTPLFVSVEGKPCGAVPGETNWALTSDEVEPVEVAA